MRIPVDRLGRLRLLISVVLALGAFVSAAATLSDQLHLRLWAPLTVLLAVLAVLWPTLQDWLKQDEARLDKQDQKEDQRAKEQADRAREDILAQVRRAWVQPELRGSLRQQARIELGLAERPAAVDNPLRAVLRRPDEPDHLVEPGQPIAHVYRQLGKQLLILGEPGAGKTTLLMELADHLIEGAKRAPDQPMPVVFHLSSWAVERRPLVLWLVDELHKRYGVPRRLGQMWVDTDQVIPLLDGLDEVAAEHLGACAAAINTFHAEHGLLPLAICSRITEYEGLQAKLQLRGAIVIQPLSRIEVDRYLQQVGSPLAAVRAAAQDDQQLADLLTTPLFLSIVALTYKDKAAALVRASGTLEEWRQRVLADYIAAMFTRPQPPGAWQRYAPEQTVRWLGWLAAAMSAHGQSVFYLDWMQPDWLPSQKQRRFVTVGSAVLAGLGFLLISGLISGVLFGVAGGLISGVAFGLIFGVPGGLMVGLAAYHPTITPTERMQWTRASLRRNFRRWFVRGGLGGLGISFIFWLGVALLSRNGLDTALVGALILGLPTGLIIGLLFGLLSGLQTESYVTPPAPGKAVQVSKRNALLSGLPIGLAITLSVGQVLGLSGVMSGDLVTRLLAGWLVGLPVGLGVGFITGLQRGGGAYLRHQVLRRLLVRNRSIPRHYVAFLDYATRLILLRRRGGGYEFVHRLLLEHFAALEPRSWHAHASQHLSQGSLAPGPSVDQQSAGRGA